MYGTTNRKFVQLFVNSGFGHDPGRLCAAVSRASLCGGRPMFSTAGDKYYLSICEAARQPPAAGRLAALES